MSRPPFTRIAIIAPLIGFFSVAVWAAGIVELIHFVRSASLYSHVFINSDEDLYMGMGRGLLNGLQIYRDLFETKPPLIFWISAFSLWTTGGNTVLHYLHAAGLLLIPAVLASFACYLGRTRSLKDRFLFAGIAMLFGAALASFAISRTLGFQPEGFGVAASALALVAFAGEFRERRAEIGRIIFIAASITTAVLTKEPFALSILGGMIVLVKSRDDIWIGAKAIALACVLWLSILLVTGTAGSYFSVYLPEMLHGRVSSELIYHAYNMDKWFAASNPLWFRGLNFNLVFHDLFFSPFLLLAMSIATLFLTHQSAGGTEDRRWRFLLMGTGAILSTFLFVRLAYALEQIVAIVHFVPLSDEFFRGKCLELAFFGLVVSGLFAALWRYSRETAKRGCAIITAFYLATAAVGIGGYYYPQHFLFAVPVYVASFIALLLHVHRGQPHPWAVGTLSVVGTLLVLNTVNPQRSFPTLSSDDMKRDAASREARQQAPKLDALLTACGVRRYFGDAVPGTIHSPYQLADVLYRVVPSPDSPVSSPQKPNPFFRAKTLRDFAETHVIVLTATTEFPYPELLHVFRTQFALDPPACATPHLPIEGLQIFFRRA